MHLVEILLPLFCNNGQPQEPRQLELVRIELTERFGGLTAYTRSPAEGFWKDAGQTKKDQIIVIEVMVPRLLRTWWRGYRSELEKRFQQDKIIIRVSEISEI